MARKNKNAGSNDSQRKGKNRIFSGKTLDKATRARIEKQLAESRERDIRAMEEKNKRIAERRNKSIRAENRNKRIDDRDFRADIWEKYPHLALDKNAPKPDKMSKEDWARYKEIQGIGKLSHEQYKVLAERVDEETMERIRAMPSEGVEDYFEYIAQNPLEDPLSQTELFDPLSDEEQMALDEIIQNYIRSL
jgi:hypothetical protein